MEITRKTALIIAEPHEMMNSHPIWGTGGWLPPQERRALDWFTLCRLMGLRVLVTTREEYSPALVERNIEWLIIACDPETVDKDLITKLKSTLEENSITVICQASEIETPLALWLETHSTDENIRGEFISTRGLTDGWEFRCRNPVEIRGLHAKSDSSIIAQLDEFPLIASIRIGEGKMIVTSFDPGEMRDREGVFTSLLQQLIVFSSTEPLAWVDWRNTLVLRMDDPGSSETVYNQSYGKAKLGSEDWKRIGGELAARSGRMSVGYVSGWVDAGDCVPGALQIDGKQVSREQAKVYPSPTVQFECSREDETVFYDHVDEFNGLQALRSSRLVEVELHGYTHISPDREAWLGARDKFENNSWFREFGPQAVRFIQQNPGIAHPIDEALKLFKLFFNSKPTTLICPGEEFTNHVLIKALDEGLMLVSSYYLAIRDQGQLCWAQHVCAPYLDAPGAKWFDSGLPVVGYFHDFDITEKGVHWFTDCLDQWQQAGAGRITDFSEVNAVLNLKLGIEAKNSDWELEVHTDARFPLPRPFELHLYFPDGLVPAVISSIIDAKRVTLNVTKIDRCVGSVVIGIE